MKHIHSDWEQTLDTMELTNFDAWWNRAADSVENPNIKANNPDAWSNVCSLKTPTGKTLFLKRQQDFYPNNLLQRFRKQLTFEREFQNHQRVKKAGIPVYDLVYFESRIKDGHRQAIYVAEELNGFTSLDKLLPVWNAQGWPPRADRRRMLASLLETVKRLHSNGILHNALSPRHLFFNLSLENPYTIPEELEFGLIDFERLKELKPGSDKGIQRDLFTLHRRCIGWPTSDRVWFLKKYLGIDKLDARAKKIARRFIKESTRRNQR